jgi:hypothetical protein
MADIAFGVVGVVGVALDASITTYNFISSIAGAPKAIKTLANHIENLKSFLEPFHELISKPAIRNRAQNVRFIPSVEGAVSGFEGVLKGLENEVKQYVKYVVGSSTPSWGGWGSWRRVKYAFNKSSMIELEASLLGRMSALHLSLVPMDL